MLVIMSNEANDNQLRRVKDRIGEMGYAAHSVKWHGHQAFGITGNKGKEDRIYLEGLPGVLRVVLLSKPYKLASRETQPENSIYTIGSATFGDGNGVMIAGPCAVESEEQTLRITDQVAQRGAQMLRGGAYKPRTSRRW